MTRYFELLLDTKWLWEQGLERYPNVVRGTFQLCHCPPSCSWFSSDHKGWDPSHGFTACITNDMCRRDHWTTLKTTKQHIQHNTAWHSTSKLMWLLYTSAYVLKASNTWLLTCPPYPSYPSCPWSLELIGTDWNCMLCPPVTLSML